MKFVRQQLIQRLLHSRIAIAVLLAMPGMGLLLLLVQALIGGINREVVVGALFGAFLMPFWLSPSRSRNRRTPRREWRVGIVVTVSLLLGALLAESLAFRIAFVILAVGSAVLTTLALHEDRRARNSRTHGR